MWPIFAPSLFQTKLLFEHKFLGSMHFLPWIFNPFEWNPVVWEVHPRFPRNCSGSEKSAVGAWADCSLARNKNEQTPIFVSSHHLSCPFPRPLTKITMIWWYQPDLTVLKVEKKEDHPKPSVDLWAIDLNASRPKLSNLMIWIDLQA